MVNRSPVAVITGINRYLSAVPLGDGARFGTAAAALFLFSVRQKKGTSRAFSRAAVRAPIFLYWKFSLGGNKWL